MLPDFSIDRLGLPALFDLQLQLFAKKGVDLRDGSQVGFEQLHPLAITHRAEPGLQLFEGRHHQLMTARHEAAQSRFPALPAFCWWRKAKSIASR